MFRVGDRSGEGSGSGTVHPPSSVRGGWFQPPFSGAANAMFLHESRMNSMRDQYHLAVLLRPDRKTARQSRRHAHLVARSRPRQRPSPLKIAENTSRWTRSRVDWNTSYSLPERPRCPQQKATKGYQSQAGEELRHHSLPFGRASILKPPPQTRKLRAGLVNRQAVTLYSLISSPSCASSLHPTAPSGAG